MESKTEMKNRVYGAIGIKSIMSNWNADFTGYPKETSDGTIFGSDKALKFPMKKMWQANGKDVLYIKSYKVDEKGKFGVNTLASRYEELKGEIKKENVKSTLSNLFECLDVINFGATFAEKGQNISITGAVQIGQGFNKYEETTTEVQDILSPFSTGDEKNNASIGKKIVVNEAHYLYPFSVNPNNYDDYKKLEIENFVGYTKEAYEEFKKAGLYSATAFNTNSKSGCENEFAIFVECKEDSLFYMANVDTYIDFKKDGEKNTYDISKLLKILENNASQIEKIEIYFNEINTNVLMSELKSKFNIEVKSLY